MQQIRISCCQFTKNWMRLFFIVFFSITLLTSCYTTKRPLHALSAPLMPMLKNKGEAVAAANISLPFSGGTGSIKSSTAIDIQAAYAFSSNFALAASYNMGNEKLIQEDNLGFGFNIFDTLNFNRNKLELGVGYFNKIKPTTFFTYNIYAGFVIGKNAMSKSISANTNSFFNHQYLGFYIQPSFHFFADKEFKLGAAIKFSSLYNTQLNTNYNANFRRQYNFFAAQNRFSVLEVSGSAQYCNKDLPQLGLNGFMGLGGSINEKVALSSRSLIIGVGVLYYPFVKKKKN